MGLVHKPKILDGDWSKSTTIFGTYGSTIDPKLQDWPTCFRLSVL
ncbi:uncharacterized protein G2W53_013026 [Senna tora]|uniref:Uncharacterized protein n=1 Tax=Senna tora TaxID=362788 RepID=A0A834TY32_9FABA|nr:uncharacterized protein G2W53_013026 [Senna tora]